MVKLKDIINLIHDNDVRIVDELGTGVYLLQGNYSSDAISVEYLNREANIYRQRKNHKLDEWREVCKWIESLPYSELITGLPIESDQAVEEKRFTQPFPWIKEDVVYCDNCEHFHDCLNKGGLTDVTISDDITEGRYIKKPRYDCPKEKE